MTSTAYYPTIKWYYYNATGAAWVDISGYVLTKQGVSGHWGMRSNKYTDRLAATGEMRMLLDNADGVFDPDDAQVLTGWAINTKVKMVVTFDGVNYTRFYGKVDTLKFSDPNTHEHTAQVLVSDWMGYAYKKTLGEQSIETYKRGGELCAEIVTAVGQTPLATSYAVGDYEFPAAFDGVTTTTKAATELNKIVLSENGYFYNRHDKVNGETVTFEAESTRNGLRTVSKLPKLAADCGLWELEANTDLVLMEDGTSFVTLDEVQDAHINGTAQRYDRTHGENILNKVTVTTYPKRVDTEQQTIYSLGTPLMLAPGETKTVTVKYQNTTTKENCNAITELCSQPVATTDYLMNRNKAGTSTNITANSTVSVVFHTADAAVTFTNASAYTGYVTRLYLKGFGVYQDASIKAEASDSTSITAYGDRELNIEQQYQRDAVMGEGLAAKILAMEKDPRTKLEKVTLIANTSSVHVLAFLNIDIGDMVKITESDMNLAYYYYVNGIEFSVAEGDVITFSWVLEENSISGYSGGLTGVAVEFTGDYQFISYPSVGKLTNPDEMTILLSVYLDTLLSGTNYYRYILTKLGFIQEMGENDVILKYSGFELMHTYFQLGSGNRFYFNNFCNGYCYYGWTEPITVTEEWIRLALTFDKRNKLTKTYINGSISVSSTFVETTLAKGDGYYSFDDVGNIIKIGSWSPVGAAQHALDKAIDGKLKIILLYDRVLTDDEIALDNATPGCITNGIVFNPLYVPSKDLTHYTDLEMTESDVVFDNFVRRVGIPNNSPTCRLIS